MKMSTSTGLETWLMPITGRFENQPGETIRIQTQTAEEGSMIYKETPFTGSLESLDTWVLS